MERAEVVVVGAGPAGLAAAALLGEHGADVLVVDEQRAAGGQIWRRPQAGLEGVPPPGRAAVAAAERAPGVRWALETSVWAVFGLAAPLDGFAGGPDDGIAVGLDGPGGIRRVAAERVLLATGAYDLPVAFPGWTLPGVMGAGAVQAFVKSQSLLPGRRFVLAGAHPLLVTIADQLLTAGGEVALLAFAGRRPSAVEAAAALPAVPGNVQRLAASTRSLQRLRRAGVPVELGRLVVRAEGDAGLEAVVVAAVDEGWAVLPGSERRIGCDVLALGYGFVPSIELARQAGCACSWDAAAGGWIVQHDRWLRTSRRAVFAAGELTGVAGAEQALEEGRLAALGILHDLGRLSAARADGLARPVRRRLGRLRRFSRRVQQQFSLRHDALARLADPATTVCRCEGITAGGLSAALAENPQLGTADAVKLLTRAGMGRCQGRLCSGTVTQLVAAATGRPVEEVGGFTARAPVKPIGLAALADAAGV